MFLKRQRRRSGGEDYDYWSLVRTVRTARGPCHQVVARLRKLEGTEQKAAGIANWPRNGLRHSFASYHLARHQNEQMTMLIMGHAGGSSMLHSHYKGLVSRVEAERYWALLPSESMERRARA